MSVPTEFLKVLSKDASDPKLITTNDTKVTKEDLAEIRCNFYFRRPNFVSFALFVVNRTGLKKVD